MASLKKFTPEKTRWWFFPTHLKKSEKYIRQFGTHLPQDSGVKNSRKYLSCLPPPIEKPCDLEFSILWFPTWNAWNASTEKKSPSPLSSLGNWLGSSFLKVELLEQKKKQKALGIMGTSPVYLPTWMVDFYGDLLGIIFFPQTLS